MKTVKEVSKLTGISVRTLHYYHEIGLLKPTQFNESGYRLYDHKALETLQQILFFKEFDMRLKDIKSIMLNKDFNKNKTFMDQKKILIMKRNRLDSLIGLIDDILKGDGNMSFKEFGKKEIEELFNAMLANINEEQLSILTKQYGDIEHFKDDFIFNADSQKAQGDFKKLVEWYGDREEVMNAVKSPNSSDIVKSYQDRILEICGKLSALQEVNVNSIEIKKLIGEYESISKQLFKMKDVRALLLEIAKEYMENADIIKANDEQFGKGSSVFIGKAITNFYQG